MPLSASLSFAAAWLVVGTADCASRPTSGAQGGGPPAPPPTSSAQPAVRPLPESAHLLTTDNAQAGEPGVRVLRDRAAWEATWRELHAGLDAGVAPAVDFARDMVVLVAAGQRSSGGHSVRVDGTSAGADGALVLHVTSTVPGPDCMSTMALTSPADVVRVPRAPAVRTTTRTVNGSC